MKKGIAAGKVQSASTGCYRTGARKKALLLPVADKLPEPEKQQAEAIKNIKIDTQYKAGKPGNLFARLCLYL